MFRNYRRKKIFAGRRSGFTLIELLVVMFIISLLSVVMMADYRAGQKKYLVDKAAQTLAADLRRAQSLALSGSQSKADDGSFVSGAGVHIDNGAASYTIFADTVVMGNEKYVYRFGGSSYRYNDTGYAYSGSFWSPRCLCDLSWIVKDCGSFFSAAQGSPDICFDVFRRGGYKSELYQKKSFNVVAGDKSLGAVSLPSGLTISLADGTPKADIFFEPPRPTTYIDYKNGANGASSKIFTLTNGAYSKNVTVDLSGRIDIQ